MGTGCLAVILCLPALATGAGSSPSAGVVLTAATLSQTQPGTAQPSAAERLSGLLPKRFTDKKDAPPPADPFATARAQAPAAVFPAGTNPPGAQPMPPGPATAEMPGPIAPLGADANRRRSDELLITARQALSVGDSRRASELNNQAKTMQVSYGFLDDSPGKVEALINKHGELMQRRQASPNPEIFNRQYSELLLEQADSLIRWQRLDDAERLATDASRLSVSYSPFETKPDDLLKRIAAVRSGAGARMQQAGMPPSNNAAAGPLANANPGLNPLAPPAGASSGMKAQAAQWTMRARQALNAGELLSAERWARQAEDLRVPENAYAPQEDRPAMVLLDIQKARVNGGVRTAGQPPQNQASQAIYNPATDPARNVRASQETLPPPSAFPAPAAGAKPPEPIAGPGAPPAGQFAPRTPPTGAPGALADDFATQQQMLYKKVSTEVGAKESSAKKLQTTNPQQSLVLLQEAKALVEGSGLEPQTRGQMLRRLDRELADVGAYIEENRVMLKLDAQNKAVTDENERMRKNKVEVQEKLAMLVDEFNKLMDEQRFPEAEVVAKRAQELAPDEQVVLQIKNQVTFVRRFMNQQDIRAAKEEGVYAAMTSVDESSIPFDDRNPIRFPDIKQWDQLTKNRSKYAENGLKRSEKDLDIERKLKTPVSLQFHDAPLSQVMDYLARLTQVNMHLDPQGLADAGVTSNTPVTIDLSQDISLKSALNLILQPLQLSYVIKDEVLKITSEELRDGVVYPVTYNVADLVIPIPNFMPGNNMGMGGALASAMQSAGSAGSGAMGTGFGGAPMVAASTNGTNASQVMIDPAILAQTSSSGGLTSSGGPAGAGGPGGLGGGSQADFDSLIELITSTVAPTTWDAVGGPGSIAPFATNLSLVISQTQEVHEQIQDLLEQLRRLQDLQVTIEVRFITLNDNFFERIGIDFDFDLNDRIDKPYMVFGKPSTPAVDQNDATLLQDRNTQDRDHGPSVSVGLDPQGNFSSDLDIPFQQGSYALSVPQFGNFSPGSGATLGFAILSDLEAFFVIEAAQGDRRSNVLQAPKVTLFNGQVAVVSDTSQSPFVISVIPVVGDFAAAQQPVVVVLSEGTFLTVQAVVSSDRRFVRMTVVPFFSQIGEVNTFQFTGSTTSTDAASSDGPDNAVTRRARDRSVTQEGTTVQLPTFSFVSVVTTVSVPDGGTVLLGGIKRLSEGRSEFGVPMLNKIPYVSRLFKNVGIGRETQSLMMMVTPRIIIQEEEEKLLGIDVQP